MGEGTKAKKITTLLCPISGPHQSGEDIWCSFWVVCGPFFGEEEIFYDTLEDAELDLIDLKQGPLDLHEEEDVYDEEYYG